MSCLKNRFRAAVLKQLSCYCMLCKIYFACPSLSFQKGGKKNAGTVQLLYNTTSVLTNSATCSRNSKQIMWNITRGAGNAWEMHIVTGMFCQEIKFSHLSDSFFLTWSIRKVPIHTNNCCIWSTTKCSKCKNKWPRQETCLASVICSISSKSNSAKGTKDNRSAQHSCWLATSACVVRVNCSLFLSRCLNSMMLTYQLDVVMFHMFLGSLHWLLLTLIFTHWAVAARRQKQKLPKPIASQSSRLCISGVYFEIRHGVRLQILLPPGGTKVAHCNCEISLCIIEGTALWFSTVTFFCTPWSCKRSVSCVDGSIFTVESSKVSLKKLMLLWIPACETDRSESPAQFCLLRESWINFLPSVALFSSPPSLEQRCTVPFI